MEINLNTVLVFFEILALAAVAVLCIYLVTVLVRLRSILTIIEEDIRELSARAMPIFENLEVITNKIKNVTESIDEQIDIVKQSVNAVRQVVDTIVDFEHRIQERIEEPVMDTVNMIAALLQGVRSFLARLRA